ncbi:MAG: hypothetical protein AAGD43_17460 [Pseudomonadota bacterium]
MRTIWVILLSLIVFALGFGGSLAYSGYKASTDAFSLLCHVLDEGERNKDFTRVQRGLIIDRTVAKMQRADTDRDRERGGFLKDLKTGCIKIAPGIQPKS